MKNKETKGSISITEIDGKKWIEIDVYKHHFLLDIANLEIGKTWEEANKIAADKGCRLPSKEEFAVIIAYLDEIDEIIEKHGGDKLRESYLWSSSEYNGSIAWCFSGAYGALLYNNKMYGFGARAVK